ncbi:MAG: DUF1318 domain-containing protein [Calditrichaeota bacterium]|nr:MAG: DUF1318 domain-containing protein [Calditrichota bacterium]
MKKLISSAIIFTVTIHCSIKTPEITLTGEKTALESQILGAYEQLSTQNLATTSARTSTNAVSAAEGQQESVLQAMQNQQFNKDEIDELKRSKVIGENRAGYLEILGSSKYESDPVYKNIVDKIVADENRDRRIIYQRLLAVDASSEKENTDALSTFAKIQGEKSEVGTMIQQPDGQWIEKAKSK